MNNLKNKTISFLKSFDFFGERLNFQVHKESAYNSPIGGCFCLAFLIYTLVYIIISYSDFANGKNKFKEYDMQVDPSPEIKLTDHKYFSLAFCIRNEDYSINQYLSTTLKMEFNHHNTKLQNKTLVTDKHSLDLINCKNINDTGISEHRTQYFQLLKNFEIDECKCINFENMNNNYSLSSTYAGIVNSFFNFNLKFNGNQSEIQDYIGKHNPKLTVYFNEYSANISSDNDPIPLKVHVESYVIKPLFSKIVDIYFGLLSFTDFNSKTSKGDIN